MIQEIELSKLKIHPKNVRKEYREIDDLTESIKAQGILQNLTVVPDPEEDGCYLVVIGNRRLAAARKAGLQTAPCYVTDMDEKTQASTMLLENMQRNDLTIYEQAQGFQMVLDLGETVDSLSEKTGLSKSTIHHRLNIAKLDQKQLQEKENSEDFQLTLKCLYALEKVKDVEMRNKILKESGNSKDVEWKAKNAESEEKRRENEKKLYEMMEGIGIKKAPKKAEYEQWSGKWETVKEFDLEKEPPKKIRLEDTKGMSCVRWYNKLHVIRKRENKKTESSTYEKERKRIEKNRKEVKGRLKEIRTDARGFIEYIVFSGNAKEDLNEQIWDATNELCVYQTKNRLIEFAAGKEAYMCTQEEKDEALKRVDKLNFTQKLLIMLREGFSSEKEIAGYNGEYRKENGDEYVKVFEVLKLLGFTFSRDDDEKIIDGTHELYEVKEHE